MKPRERVGLVGGTRTQRFCKDECEEKEHEKFGTHGVKGVCENSCVRCQ